MNTHFTRTKKALSLLVLAISCSVLLQVEIVQAAERVMPESAQKYKDKDPLKVPKGEDPYSTNLFLMQPLDDKTKSLEAKPGIQIFFDYFNLSWPWVLGVCAGLAVLQAMVGGMQMMLSGMRDEGKERMKWAIAGLLIIVLSGMILTTINPIFYT